MRSLAGRVHPGLQRARCLQAPATQPSGEAGPALSIPVLTGLCRAAELALMLAASLAPGLLLHGADGSHPWAGLLVGSAVAAGVTGMLAGRCGLYAVPALLNPLGRLPHLCACLAAGGLASVLVIGLCRGGRAEAWQLDRPVTCALASAAALLAFRAVVALRLAAHAAAGRLSTRVALVGATAAGLRFIATSAADPAVTIVGIFHDDASKDRASEATHAAAQTWVRGDVDTLVALARNRAIDAVVLAMPAAEAARIADTRCRLAGIATDVFLIADPAPAATTLAGAPIAMLGANPVLCLARRPLQDWPAFTKAALDQVASAGLLLLGLPLMLAIATLVRLDSPGPALFRQRREGLNGQQFTMLKFRTMHQRTTLDESVQASRDDRRVTRVGYWLRRFSLDELPQLCNVLRGDMSLVGPRPHLATTRAGSRLFGEVAPHYQSRHRMKPGLTGLAQVQGLRGETRTEQQLLDRIEQDLHYIENWSLGLDLRIMLRTVFHEIVVSRSGRAY